MMGVTCTSRIPLLQTGHSGLAKTKLDGTSVGDCTGFCIGWFSRFALNRAVALLTVQTRPRCEHSPAKAGLQRSLFPGSEKRQKVRRKRNRRNAGAISTQPVYVQTLVPADGILAANPEERQALLNHRFGQLMRGRSASMLRGVPSPQYKSRLRN